MTTTTTVAINMAAYVAVSTAGQAIVTVQGPARTPFTLVISAGGLPAANAACFVISDIEGYIFSATGLGASDVVYVKAVDPAKLTVTVAS